MSSTAHNLLPDVYYDANDPLWWFELRKCSCGYLNDTQKVELHIAQHQKAIPVAELVNPASQEVAAPESKQE